MKKENIHIALPFSARFLAGLTFAFLLWVGNTCLGQTPVATSQEPVSLTLPEIALLDIEPDNSTVVLELPSPSEAGLMSNNVTLSNAKWINYTSAVSPGTRRKVTVQITSGTLPKGVKLSVLASNSAGGAGVLGTSVGNVVLSYSPQLLVNNIGGAYTGNGNNRGHSLSYSLEVTDMSQLDFDDSGTLTISYTLIDL